jgi:hypothetical protein
VKNAVSWHAQIGKLRLSCWASENYGRVQEVRIVGGGPLAPSIADFCEAMSIGLKAGVPVEAYVKTLRGRRDEMGGPVHEDPLVAECGSVVDYIARALNARFGPKDDLVRAAGEAGACAGE